MEEKEKKRRFGVNFIWNEGIIKKKKRRMPSFGI
jgi:hypothetical protein